MKADKILVCPEIMSSFSAGLGHHKSGNCPGLALELQKPLLFFLLISLSFSSSPSLSPSLSSGPPCEGRCICLYVCVSLYVCNYVYISVWVYLCVYVNVHVCMCVCVIFCKRREGGMKEVEGRARAKYPLKVGGDNRRPEKMGEKVEVA